MKIKQLFCWHKWTPELLWVYKNSLHSRKACIKCKKVDAFNFLNATIEEDMFFYDGEGINMIEGARHLREFNKNYESK